MTKRTTLLCLGLTMLVGLVAWKPAAIAPAKAQEKPAVRPQNPALARFMRAKLEASSSILEGLTIEDFELIEAGAKKLQVMSAAEEWRVSNDPLYRQHSAEFRRIAEQLQEKARKKDLDGSALAWVAATMNCIECHRWARAQMIVEK